MRNDITTYSLNDLMIMREELLRNQNLRLRFTISEINAESDRRRNLGKTLAERTDVTLS